MSKAHDPDLAEKDETPVAPPEEESKTISPFVIMQRGFGTVDPADSNRVVFEDFSPRVMPSDAPDEEVDLDELVIPKGLSVLAPASSSESPPPTEPPPSEEPASPEATEDQLPFPMTPSLPEPPAVVPGDGKPNPPASG